MTVTKPSSLRIPDDVKAAAQRRAEAEGRTLTDVVVAYLRRYGARTVTTSPSADKP